MPGMDGFEVCKHLRADELTRHIPIIMITAVKVDSQSYIRGLEAGADTFLTKPIEPGQMIAQLKAMLRIKAAEDRLRSEKLHFEQLVNDSKLHIKESEEKYRAIFEATGTATLVVAPDKTILMANQNCVTLTGYMPEELIGTSWDKYVSEESYLSLINDFANAFMHPKTAPKNYEARLVRKDGSKRDAILTIGIIISVQQMIVSILDVTESNASLQALKENEERFRTLYENTALGLYRTTPGGKILLANPAMVKMLGFDSFEDLSNRNLEKEGFETSFSRKQFIDQIEKEGQIIGLVAGWQKKDGTTIYVRENAKAIRDKNGKSLYYDGTVEDITEQKMARERLRKSEEQFRRLFEDHAAVKLIVDPETGNIVDANKAAARFYGWSKHELKAMKIDQINTLPPDKVKQEMENAHMPKKTFFEFKHRLKDGSVKDVAVFSSKVEWEGKTCLHSIIHDITQSKEAGKLIRTLSAVVEQSPISIVITDAHGRVEYVNDKFTQSTQYILEEVQNKLPRIFNKGHLPPADYDRMWAELKSGNIWMGEYENRRKDGSTMWEIASIAPLYDTDGNIANYVLIKQDITQRKKDELFIRLLSQSVEQSPVSVMITDKEGYFIYVNSTFEKNTGYHLAEIKDQTPRILKSGEHSREFFTQLWQTILDGKVWQGEILNKRNNGEKYWDSAIISPIVDRAGNITHFVAVQQDITHQKEMLEELVKAKEKAEESERLKSAFLANMSHEIRTPMNGILGFASLLQDPGLSGEEQQEYVSVIEKSGKRMLNTINDIMDISKIEAGMEKVVTKKVDLLHTLKDIYGLYKQEARDKGLQFTYRPAPTNGTLKLTTDERKFYSVLSNLVKNAIKYTSKGFVEMGFTLKNKTLEFYVKDSGIGIPRDRQQAVFERFIQADIEDKMAMQGSGLGLSIAKAYVEMLGGKIWLEYSEPGKGSEFRFTIPFETAGQEEKENQDNSTIDTHAPAVHNLKILIAEDDETSFSYLSIILKSIASTILFAKNGQEAIDRMKEHPDIDLIIMDMQMPEVNGFEATRKIRKFNKKVIIIAQTAYAMAGDKERVLAAGCNEYIAKPFSKSQILKLIKKYFNQEKNSSKASLH
jgi:PAS domain S-box-containing protein